MSNSWQMASFASNAYLPRRVELSIRKECSILQHDKKWAVLSNAVGYELYDMS